MTQAQSQQAPAYYAVIPANVRYCKQLSSSAKLLYGEITALCSKEGYCWASNKHFADLYEVDNRSIKRWISSLRELGFIECECSDDGSQNPRKIWIIQNNIVPKKPKELGGTKMSGGREENVTHNNTFSTTSSKEKESVSLEQDLSSVNIRTISTLANLTPAIDQTTAKDDEILSFSAKKKDLVKIPQAPIRKVEILSCNQENQDDVPSVDISFLARRWKLTPDQVDSLLWLVNRKIDTAPQTLAYWCKIYSLKRLQDVYKLSKKKSKTSIGAYMNKLLSANAIVENDNSKLCYEFALSYQEANHWGTMEVLQSYVKIQTSSGSPIEVPYSMNHVEFAKKIMDLHERAI